jgi:hypothetical protein
MAEWNRLGIECARTRGATAQPYFPNHLPLMASTKPIFLEAKKALGNGGSSPRLSYRGAPSARDNGGASARLVGLGQSGLSLEPIDGASGC